MCRQQIQPFVLSNIAIANLFPISRIKFNIGLKKKAEL